MAIVSLLLLTVLVYWPVYRFGFLRYDDQFFVWQNRYVAQGWTHESIHYAFTEMSGGWGPLLWLSFMTDRVVFGATPSLEHLENVLLHMAGGVLLWVLLTKMTSAPWRSWVVAALFLCHPMHVESVAWVSERKDVLSTPTLLGAMLAYWWYCQSPPGHRRWIAYGLLLLLFMVSLLSKAMGVTLPALLLLMDFWPLRRFRAFNLKDRDFRRAVFDKIPVTAITGLFCVMAMVAQQSSGATSAGAVLPLSDRVDNAIVCDVIYIVKLVIPTNLAAFYPHPGSRPLAAIVPAAGLLVLISWFVIRQRGRAPYLLVGWFWFTVALLPVIGIVQIGGQAMADRYSYLPSIGFFMAVVWGSCDLLGRVGLPVAGTTGRWVAGVVTAAMLIALSVTAHRQVWYWKDTETLFLHCYDVTGPNPVACFQLGVAAEERSDLRGAIDNFDIVIEQDPGNDKALKLLGDIWINSDLDKAIDYYGQAVELKPKRTDYRILLAASLARRADTESLEAAAMQLRRVLALEPGNVPARTGLVDVLSRLKLQGNR
jgi:hypothetical protein